MQLRSDEQYLGIERSLQRAWAKGAGLIDEEFEQPMIAVVNTYQEFSPENVHLRRVGEAVKAGIRMAGGTPGEFNTFHVTDSETFASVGMRYVLPSRDLVADMIELMIEGHRFDAMVLIGSGDKVMPGMVMAAARLDIPAIVLYGGPTKAGIYKNRKVFLETVYDGVGKHLLGKITEEDLKGLEDNHFPFSARVIPRHRVIPPASIQKRWDFLCRTPALFPRGATTSFARRNTPECRSCTCCARTYGRRKY